MQQYAPTAYGFAGSSLQVRIHKPIFALSASYYPSGRCALLLGEKSGCLNRALAELRDICTSGRLLGLSRQSFLVLCLL